MTHRLRFTGVRKGRNSMIRQATSADIVAIAATYEDLLTYEQEHGGDSHWELGVYPTIAVPKRAVPAGGDDRAGRGWWDPCQHDIEMPSPRNTTTWHGSIPAKARMCLSCIRCACRRGSLATGMEAGWCNTRRNMRPGTAARSSASTPMRITSRRNACANGADSASQGGGRIAPRAHGRGAGVSGVRVAMSIGVVAVPIGE